MKKTYGKEFLKSIPRLLSLQDRRPFSQTEGCFDKNYWHFKTSDFPNSASQMGIEALAKAWDWEDSNNIYYKNKQILNWTKSGMLYLCKIQYKDGSFDEWYPGEKGWAGPTGYVVHSLCETYNLLCEELTSIEKDLVLATIEKAARHLCVRDEKQILANHFAVTMMALDDSWNLLKKEWILEGYNNWWDKFKELITVEGWSLEYDGVDFGYNLATLSFLAKIHSKNNCPEIEAYAKKSFDFLSYFVMPDKTFGGRLGSRNTSHIYPFALEYWSARFETAKAMALHYRSVASSLCPPSIQDDHYIMYRLCDYLDAENDKEGVLEKVTLPFESKESWVKFFNECGIFIKKTENYYFLANLKKGGSFSIYNLKNCRAVCIDSGLIGKVNGRYVTSQVMSQRWKIKNSDGSCETSGPLEQVRNKYFNPKKLILFRFVTEIAKKSSYLSYLLKQIIRKLMIVGERPYTKSMFCRKFIFSNNEIKVEDEVNLKYKGDFSLNTDFSVRYVPQSQYFHINDLDQSPFFLSANPGKTINVRSWTL
jgi:hypothetical protein